MLVGSLAMQAFSFWLGSVREPLLVVAVPSRLGRGGWWMDAPPLVCLCFTFTVSPCGRAELCACVLGSWPVSPLCDLLFLGKAVPLYLRL